MFRIFIFVIILIHFSLSLQFLIKQQFKFLPANTICEIDYNERKQLLEIDCENEIWIPHRKCSFPIAGYDECLCRMNDCLNGINAQFGIIFEGHQELIPFRLENVEDTNSMSVVEKSEPPPNDLEGSFEGYLGIFSYIIASILWFLKARAPIANVFRVK
ncbi:unnamed protein product, partial [Mesorhabditis belari]|uniref:Uncharacterized protein n=1 Tax=Mesorhabditis belari TaxID=2138241 RepID=A0AAF3JAX3_9BILA